MARPPNYYDQLRKTEAQGREALNQQLESTKLTESIRRDFNPYTNEVIRSSVDPNGLPSMTDLGNALVKFRTFERQQHLSNNKREALDNQLKNIGTEKSQENTSKRDALNQALSGQAQQPAPEQKREQLNQAIENKEKGDKSLQTEFKDLKTDITRTQQTIER